MDGVPQSFIRKKDALDSVLTQFSHSNLRINREISSGIPNDLDVQSGLGDLHRGGNVLQSADTVSSARTSLLQHPDSINTAPLATNTATDTFQLIAPIENRASSNFPADLSTDEDLSSSDESMTDQGPVYWSALHKKSSPFPTGPKNASIPKSSCFVVPSDDEDMDSYIQDVAQGSSAQGSSFDHLSSRVRAMSLSHGPHGTSQTTSNSTQASFSSASSTFNSTASREYELQQAILHASHAKLGAKAVYCSFCFHAVAQSVFPAVYGGMGPAGDTHSASEQSTAGKTTPEASLNDSQSILPKPSSLQLLWTLPSSHPSTLDPHSVPNSSSAAMSVENFAFSPNSAAKIEGIVDLSQTISLQSALVGFPTRTFRHLSVNLLLLAQGGSSLQSSTSTAPPNRLHYELEENRRKQSRHEIRSRIRSDTQENTGEPTAATTTTATSARSWITFKEYSPHLSHGRMHDDAVAPISLHYRTTSSTSTGLARLQRNVQVGVLYQYAPNSHEMVSALVDAAQDSYHPLFCPICNTEIGIVYNRNSTAHATRGPSASIVSSPDVLLSNVTTETIAAEEIAQLLLDIELHCTRRSTPQLPSLPTSHSAMTHTPLNNTSMTHSSTSQENLLLPAVHPFSTPTRPETASSPSLSLSSPLNPVNPGIGPATDSLSKGSSTASLSQLEPLETHETPLSLGSVSTMPTRSWEPALPPILMEEDSPLPTFLSTSIPGFISSSAPSHPPSLPSTAPSTAPSTPHPFASHDVTTIDAASMDAASCARSESNFSVDSADPMPPVLSNAIPGTLSECSVPPSELFPRQTSTPAATEQHTCDEIEGYNPQVHAKAAPVSEPPLILAPMPTAFRPTTGSRYFGMRRSLRQTHFQVETNAVAVQPEQVQPITPNLNSTFFPSSAATFHVHKSERRRHPRQLRKYRSERQDQVGASTAHNGEYDGESDSGDRDENGIRHAPAVSSAWTHIWPEQTSKKSNGALPMRSYARNLKETPEASRKWRARRYDDTIWQGDDAYSEMDSQMYSSDQDRSSGQYSLDDLASYSPDEFSSSLLPTVLPNVLPKDHHDHGRVYFRTENQDEVGVTRDERHGFRGTVYSHTDENSASEMSESEGETERLCAALDEANLIQSDSSRRIQQYFPLEVMYQKNADQGLSEEDDGKDTAAPTSSAAMDVQSLGTSVAQDARSMLYAGSDLDSSFSESDSENEGPNASKSSQNEKRKPIEDALFDATLDEVIEQQLQQSRAMNVQRRVHFLTPSMLLPNFRSSASTDASAPSSSRTGGSASAQSKRKKHTGPSAPTMSTATDTYASMSTSLAASEDCLHLPFPPMKPLPLSCPSCFLTIALTSAPHPHLPGVSMTPGVGVYCTPPTSASFKPLCARNLEVLRGRLFAQMHSASFADDEEIVRSGGRFVGEPAAVFIDRDSSASGEERTSLKRGFLNDSHMTLAPPSGDAAFHAQSTASTLEQNSMQEQRASANDSKASGSIDRLRSLRDVTWHRWFLSTILENNPPDVERCFYNALWNTPLFNVKCRNCLAVIGKAYDPLEFLSLQGRPRVEARDSTSMQAPINAFSPPVQFVFPSFFVFPSPLTPGLL